MWKFTAKRCVAVILSFQEGKNIIVAVASVFRAAKRVNGMSCCKIHGVFMVNGMANKGLGGESGGEGGKRKMVLSPGWLHSLGI